MKDSLNFFPQQKNTVPKKQALEFYYLLPRESGKSEVLRRGLNAAGGVGISGPQSRPLGNAGDLSQLWRALISSQEQIPVIVFKQTSLTA